MPLPSFVDPLEIGAAQQTGTARKESLLLSPLNTSLRLSFRSDGAHGGLLDRTASLEAAQSRATRNYSRNPGFTETRLRPLARRRESTFWPPWVFIRTRNPCFLDRLRRLGWNVRLGMKSSLLLIRWLVLRQTMSINEETQRRQRQHSKNWRLSSLRRDRRTKRNLSGPSCL